MTFNAAIPQAGDLISQSQAQILTNFSQSNTAFGVDHTAFDVVSNQGFHKQVTLIAPVAASATGAKGILHSVNGAGVTFNGVPLPFFSNNLADYPLIADLLNTSGTNFSFTLGNMVFKLGTATFSAANPNKTATVTYGTAFPTAVVGVYCQGYVTGNNSIQLTGAPTTAGFSVSLTFGNGTTPTFSYLAIGY
jgi:hypothetical protein